VKAPWAGGVCVLAAMLAAALAACGGSSGGCTKEERSAANLALLETKDAINFATPNDARALTRRLIATTREHRVCVRNRPQANRALRQSARLLERVGCFACARALRREAADPGTPDDPVTVP
jgi:hypothetical protein